MNKLIASIILVISTSNICFADCDWSTGITPGPNKTFIYSEACHQAVGKLVQDTNLKDQQINDLNKAIQLKDLALKQSDDRATLWSNTSSNLEDRLQKVDSLEKKNELLWLGAGVVGTVLVGFMTARLVGR